MRDAVPIAPYGQTVAKGAARVEASGRLRVNGDSWLRREAARTPHRFRDMVISMFLAPENLAYLRSLLVKSVPPGPLRVHAISTLQDAAISFCEGEGQALDALQSDPVLQRGANRDASDRWAELRRLNQIWFSDRMTFLRENAHTIAPAAPRDGIDEDDEPYHMRMFISDSLRPPGYEHLNTPGPLYALREDQSTWVPGRYQAAAAAAASGGPGRAGGGRGGGSSRREGFAASASKDLPNVARPWPSEVTAPGPGDPEDAAWSEGNPNRTPEQAVSEYWGDNWTVSETATGAPETTGQGYGDQYAWGSEWQQNGGTRFMRYESVPFWQQGGREGIDGDIEETLGTAGRELDSHVRRWNMDRLIEPRGQEYRRYGARSGNVV